MLKLRDFSKFVKALHASDRFDRPRTIEVENVQILEVRVETARLAEEQQSALRPPPPPRW